MSISTEIRTIGRPSKRAVGELPGRGSVISARGDSLLNKKPFVLMGFADMVRGRVRTAWICLCQWLPLRRTRRTSRIFSLFEAGIYPGNAWAYYGLCKIAEQNGSQDDKNKAKAELDRHWLGPDDFRELARM